MSKRLEYLTLKNNISIAREQLLDFESQYTAPLFAYYQSLGHGRLEAIEIEDITESKICFSVETSFRGETDPLEHYEIPIEACKSFNTIKQYYDNKTMEEERNRVMQEHLEKEKMAALIAEADIREYKRLKEKFEGAKEA